MIMVRRRLNRQRVQLTDEGVVRLAEKKQNPAKKPSLRTIDASHAPSGSLSNTFRPVTPPKITRKTPAFVGNGEASPSLPIHISTKSVTDITLTNVITNLRPGAAFWLLRELELHEYYSKQYPFQVLKGAWSPRLHEPDFKVGTMVMYIGERRIDELDSRGRDIREIRHIFMIGTGQYVLTDLNTLGTSDQLALAVLMGE